MGGLDAIAVRARAQREDVLAERERRDAQAGGAGAGLRPQALDRRSERRRGDVASTGRPERAARRVGQLPEQGGVVVRRDRDHVRRRAAGGERREALRSPGDAAEVPAVREQDERSAGRIDSAEQLRRERHAVVERAQPRRGQAQHRGSRRWPVGREPLHHHRRITERDHRHAVIGRQPVDQIEGQPLRHLEGRTGHARARLDRDHDRQRRRLRGHELERVGHTVHERDQVLLAERVAVGSKQRHRERAAGVVAHRDDFHARSVLRDGASDRGQQQQQAPGKRERAAGDAGHRSGTSVLRRLRG